MSKSRTSPRALLAVGFAAASVLAIAPMAAQAADTNAAGTLHAGQLSTTAPAITAFDANLTGLTQTVTTAVGDSSVTDATGSNAGYSITVTASVPQVDGVAAKAGTGATLTLTPQSAVAADGNPAAAGPVKRPAQLLSLTASTIQNAIAGTGQGKWNIPGAPANTDLAVVIPADASAGAYSSTLTFTTAAPAA